MQPITETEAIEFEFLCYNTQTRDVFAYINGKKHAIKHFNGRYCFISNSKILDKTIFVGTIKKTKYANIFNEAGQEKIIKFINE